MAVPETQVTKDYRIFTVSADNRPRDPTKHKRLRKAMETNGFLPCYPLACVRDKEKRLVVLDGQHRLMFAEILGLPVYFMVLEESFDIAMINGTQEKWVPRNFAETFAAQGKKQYQEGLDFCDRYGIPVGIGFGLLAGTASWGNIASEYYSGGFKARDRQWAETVGTVYSHLVEMARHIRNGRLLEACMAVGRVPGFDPQRLIAGAARCREKLVSYSTRDAYLDMLEAIYNFGRKQMVPLKVSAIQAMRDRNASKAKRQRSNPCSC